MVRWLHVVAAVSMLVVVTPGGTELIEDLVHYLEHGDSLHDGVHGLGHCCSGVFHFCSCHAHAQALPTPPALSVVLETRGYSARSAHARPDSAGGPADGHLRDLIRPPTA